MMFPKFWDSVPRFGCFASGIKAFNKGLEVRSNCSQERVHHTAPAKTIFKAFQRHADYTAILILVRVEYCTGTINAIYINIYLTSRIFTIF